MWKKNKGYNGGNDMIKNIQSLMDISKNFAKENELLPLTLHTLLLLLAEGEASHHLSTNPKIKFLKFNSLLFYNFSIIKINCFKKNLVGFAT